MESAHRHLSNGVFCLLCGCNDLLTNRAARVELTKKKVPSKHRDQFSANDDRPFTRSNCIASHDCFTRYTCKIQLSHKPAGCAIFACFCSTPWVCMCMMTRDRRRNRTAQVGQPYGRSLVRAWPSFQRYCTTVPPFRRCRSVSRQATGIP